MHVFFCAGKRTDYKVKIVPMKLCSRVSQKHEKVKTSVPPGVQESGFFGKLTLQFKNRNMSIGPFISFYPENLTFLEFFHFLPILTLVSLSLTFPKRLCCHRSEEKKQPKREINTTCAWSLHKQTPHHHTSDAQTARGWALLSPHCTILQPCLPITTECEILPG